MKKSLFFQRSGLSALRPNAGLSTFSVAVFALCSLLLCSSCNNGEAEYIIEPTPIHITVLSDKTTAATAQINIAPEDDRAYFYAEVVPAGLYRPGSMDRDFMMLVMDSVYIEYLTWRYYHLLDGERYIAPFSSHSLKYGVQTLHVKTLRPKTDYMIFAFCVNPISNQPMGDFYYEYFSTDSFIQADLSFQFSLEGKSLYIMPSDDNTQYVSDYNTKDYIRNECHGNPLEYLNMHLQNIREYDLFLDYYLHSNAYRYDLEYALLPDERYLFMCAAYDGALADECYYVEIYVDPDGNPHLVSQE